MDEVVFFFGGWEPVVRILVIGTLAYAALVPMLRFSGKRTLTRMSAFDFVISVAVGAVFGRVLTARGVALAEALTALALLVALQYIAAWLQVRSAAFARFVSAPPTLLYYRGSFLSDALERERVREAELREAVRAQGLGSLDQVEAIVLEANGRFAVVKRATAGDGGALEDVPGA